MVTTFGSEQCIEVSPVRKESSDVSSSSSKSGDAEAAWCRRVKPSTSLEAAIREYADVGISSTLPQPEVLKRALSLTASIYHNDEYRGQALCEALQSSFAQRTVGDLEDPKNSAMQRTMTWPGLSNLNESGKMQNTNSLNILPEALSEGEASCGIQPISCDSSSNVEDYCSMRLQSPASAYFNSEATGPPPMFEGVYRMQSPASAYFNPRPDTESAAPINSLPVVQELSSDKFCDEKSVTPAKSLPVQKRTVEDTPRHYTSDSSLLPGACEVVEPLALEENRPGHNMQTGGPWVVPARYELEELLGSGAYGAVRSAWDSDEERKVAIKRVDGVYQDAVTCKRILREIAILSHLRHKNIVQVYDLPMPSPTDPEVLYIVMELCDTDLRKVCTSWRGVSLPQARKLSYGLLVGCRYLHSAGIYHRDLKPANCLVNRDCSVKIGDFNLAISVHSSSPSDPDKLMRSASNALSIPVPTAPPVTLRRTMTWHVASRWYRPPEVILQLGYTEAMDVWSAACIMAELFGALNEGGRRPKRGPLFPGDRDPCLSGQQEDETDLVMAHAGDQLSVIFDILGTPSKSELEALEAEDPDAADYVRTYPARPGRGLKNRLPPEATEEGLELLEKMLCLLPSDRITMSQAVRHPFLDPARGGPSRSSRSPAVSRFGEGEGASEEEEDDDDLESPHNHVDIGFDEEELDRTVSMIPRTLKNEIESFNPPPRGTTLLQQTATKDGKSREELEVQSRFDNMFDQVSGSRKW
mmetsp:Transcript_74429/g.162817  ORF Transcript_74429/g.162817 Transcript_74429/m.162817 type:complete len:755 (+) Transcript_74429:56-2320(+)